jgi:hypothetical protein
MIYANHPFLLSESFLVCGPMALNVVPNVAVVHTASLCVVGVPGMIGSSKGDGVFSGAGQQAPSSSLEGPSLSPEGVGGWLVLVSTGWLYPSSWVFKPLSKWSGVEWALSCPGDQCGMGYTFSVLNQGAKATSEWGR